MVVLTTDAHDREGHIHIFQNLFLLRGFFSVCGKTQHVSLGKMYMVSLSRAYKNIWEQDNVCPDLPKILGSSSQMHIPFPGPNAHRGCASADVWKRTSARTPPWPPIRRGSPSAPPAQSGNGISKWSLPSCKPVSGQKNSADGCVIWLRAKRSPEWRLGRFREASHVPLQASSCIKDSGPGFLTHGTISSDQTFPPRARRWESHAGPFSCDENGGVGCLLSTVPSSLFRLWPEKYAENIKETKLPFMLFFTIAFCMEKDS